MALGWKELKILSKSDNGSERRDALIQATNKLERLLKCLGLLTNVDPKGRALQGAGSDRPLAPTVQLVCEKIGYDIDHTNYLVEALNLRNRVVHESAQVSVAESADGVQEIDAFIQFIAEVTFSATELKICSGCSRKTRDGRFCTACRWFLLMPSATCPACQASRTVGAGPRFCVACRGPLVTVQCPSCKAQMTAGSMNCGSCGARL